jgi:ParB family chromosome partitioning protein
LPTRVDPVKAIFVDTGMLDQRLPRFVAVAGHDIEHTVRQTRFQRQFGKSQRRQRSHFGRLQDDRTAGGKRRRDLPCRHRQRIVPRHDLADDADRLANGIGMVLPSVARKRIDLSPDLRGPAGHVAEDVDSRRYVHRQRVMVGLAVVVAFQ